VVVNEDDGELAGVILVEQARKRLRDCGGFIAGRDDGDDSGPRAWNSVLHGVVVEFAETPECAVRDG
jgi:hypothetical protein